LVNLQKSEKGGDRSIVCDLESQIANVSFKAASSKHS
jgi:hypothetical protein